MLVRRSSRIARIREERSETPLEISGNIVKINDLRRPSELSETFLEINDLRKSALEINDLRRFSALAPMASPVASQKT
jgi:hypothetical protein